MLDCAADPYLNGLPPLVQHLRGQRRRAQPRVHHAEHLERNAVGPANQDGQRFRPGQPDQARGGYVPPRIADRRFFRSKCETSPAGKINSNSTRAQVSDGLFQGATVGEAAFSAVERIDKETDRRTAFASGTGKRFEGNASNAVLQRRGWWFAMR
jgi:hypothetical protein